MNYEKKYNDLVNDLKELWNCHTNDSQLLGELAEICPELAESEDERLRKLLVWQVHRNIEDETNDLKGSVYDGIKGHDPDLEESIEDWKKCLSYLEKQKEQKPAEWSEEDKLNTCPHYSDGYGCDISPMKKCESCEHRPSWKPSEEQMKNLLNIEGDLRAFQYDDKAKVIAELYEQLKRL